MSITYLPAVAIDGHQASGRGTPDHPMRIATRRAAGLEPGGWTGELRGEVAGFFDNLADEWHTRATPDRIGVVQDALARGLGPVPPSRAGLAVEVGSGIGIYSGMIAERFAAVLAVDLSMPMLQRAPAGPAYRIRGDGSMLPVRDRSAAAMFLVNAFLFPAEVDRVLAPGGVLVWVNTNGERTPIHLAVDEIADRLPGEWSGTASRAGQGTWCVFRRAAHHR